MRSGKWGWMAVYHVVIELACDSPSLRESHFFEGALGRGTTASTTHYRSFFPTIVRSTIAQLRYGNVWRFIVHAR